MAQAPAPADVDGAQGRRRGVSLSPSTVEDLDDEVVEAAGTSLRDDTAGLPARVVHHQQCDVVLGDVIADELAEERLDDVDAGRDVRDGAQP